MKQVRVLTLSLNVDGSTTLYRLMHGWTLQFRLGPSLLGSRVRVFTNYPFRQPDTDTFERLSYAPLPWSSDSGDTSDDTALFADIVVQMSGSFHYYLCDDEDQHCGQGFFLVDPALTVGPKDDPLPLDCIQCQTVVTKNLGPFSGWEKKLRVAKESGYNMLHFTPPQVRGSSDSAYSLADMHHLDQQYQCSWQHVKELVHKMRHDWNMLSICDIVLNHAANESVWVHEHPECTFNCSNSPHLRPAFLLDRLFHYLTVDISAGLWESRGIPKAVVDCQAHLNAVKDLIYQVYLQQINLHEFYMVDVGQMVAAFDLRCQQSHQPDSIVAEELKIIQDPDFIRFGCSVDLDVAMKLYGQWPDRTDQFRMKLQQLNEQKCSEIWSHVHAAVDNALKGAQWERLASEGPHIRECNLKHPISRNYFTGKSSSLKEEEQMMYGHQGNFFMAHNGWVMGMDPTTNFADPECHVYLRRELIAWGDSVKLNYGQKPEDCPFLWSYMKQYVEMTAEMFHGLRLDNCHSTPIHVAEYLLDAARKVRPDLYVIAELFTGSECSDNVFMNRLGITSLIREALSAWDSHEQGRLVFRYGGDPVGSFIQPTLRPLTPSVAHALFFDQTHDNPSVIKKRSVYDVLTSTALVNMACCATGSVRGYDELVPHQVHVVKEKRIYGSWEHEVGLDSGIIKAKKAILDLHDYLGRSGYNEVFVDQMHVDVVAVTRHNPVTHWSVVTVCHTAFSPDPNQSLYLELNVEGELKQVLLEMRMVPVQQAAPFKKHASIINGLADIRAEVKQNISLQQSSVARLKSSSGANRTTIELFDLRPGTVLSFSFKLHPQQDEACQSLRSMLDAPASADHHPLDTILSGLSLCQLNTVLFRCDQEERDACGGGVYSLQGRPMVYAGIQGVMSLLADIRPINDLGNWLPDNLRQGDWLMDYISGRLKTHSATEALGLYLDQGPFRALKMVPRYLIPRYFDAIMVQLFAKCLDAVWRQMSPTIQKGSFFVRALALGSVQHGAVMRSALLPPLSPALHMADVFKQEMTSLAAGLPHFSTGYMRNWGRDTFISLRGFFLLTGRFDEARAIILSYASCLRHGLIPNLLDGGVKARFNCRDAVWWWLHCIKEYVDQVPDGADILKDAVSRIFPNDEAGPCAPGQHDQPLQDVIHEALQTHFRGLSFRERNAGRQIDEHMTDQGFNNSIGVDLNTGFVFGGNMYNCGTWMDKMGSSMKSGSKGKPATPRDGSAVELVGLSYACLTWLSDLHKSGRYPHGCVNRTDPDVEWQLDQWAGRIRDHFEDSFFVCRDNPKEKRPDLVHKEDIYKDTLGSQLPWCDYQLRCNFPIAMAVAPELFNAEHAWKALQVVRHKLLGPLGMATLDPDDWNYRGYYDNSNDSDDPTVAHGFNYHQGPEWVWPVGYFLRAYLHFAKKVGGQSGLDLAKKLTMSVLSAHYSTLLTSHWRGIPELTNRKGAFCAGSNPIQAWSMACLLEVLVDIQHI